MYWASISVCFQYLPYKSKDNSLDLGLLGLESKKEAFILVVNMNPVNININNIKTSIPSAYVDVVGCNSGDYANVLLLDTYKNMTRCVSSLLMQLLINVAETKKWQNIFRKY